MGESSPLTRQANNANPAQGAAANLMWEGVTGRVLRLIGLLEPDHPDDVGRTRCRDLHEGVVQAVERREQVQYLVTKTIRKSSSS